MRRLVFVQEQQLIERLRSIKRYFLLSQGDFFLHFMDIAGVCTQRITSVSRLENELVLLWTVYVVEAARLCACVSTQDELDLPVQEVSLPKLGSLLELALRTLHTLLFSRACSCCLFARVHAPDMSTCKLFVSLGARDVRRMGILERMAFSLSLIRQARPTLPRTCSRTTSAASSNPTLCYRRYACEMCASSNQHVWT